MNKLQSGNLAILGIMLPGIWFGALAVLVLISFTSSQISSFIAAESLILLTLIFFPVICLACAAISIIALAGSGDKKKSLLAAGLNIAVLVCWPYFSKSFLMELELIS